MCTNESCSTNLPTDRHQTRRDELMCGMSVCKKKKPVDQTRINDTVNEELTNKNTDKDEISQYPYSSCLSSLTRSTGHGGWIFINSNKRERHCWRKESATCVLLNSFSGTNDGRDVSIIFTFEGNS